MNEVQSIYIDNWLQHNLDILKVNIRRDMDFWILGDGLEGSGKSTLVTQCAAYCDPEFSIERIAFTPSQFIRAVKESKRYQAVVWDEAITGLQSTDMTRMARTLKSMAVQMRQKNLFVFLVMHSYFDMSKYYAVHRAWFLLHTYFKPNSESKLFERGYFSFYDFRKKNIMYLTDKYRKNYEYGLQPNFRGRFANHYGVDDWAYRNKKATSVDNQDDAKAQEQVWLDVSLKKEIPYSVLKPYLTCSKQTYYTRKKSVKESSEEYNILGESEENERNDE